MSFYQTFLSYLTLFQAKTVIFNDSKYRYYITITFILYLVLDNF